MSREVDDYVREKLRPEQREAATMLRKLVAECAPDAEEVISYGIPAWRRKRMIAVISPTKTDLTFAFSRGAQFEDPYGLLQGVGKVSKHVKIKDLAAPNVEALRHYIAQAIKLDDDS